MEVGLNHESALASFEETWRPHLCSTPPSQNIPPQNIPCGFRALVPCSGSHCCISWMMQNEDHQAFVELYTDIRGTIYTASCSHPGLGICGVTWLDMFSKTLPTLDSSFNGTSELSDTTAVWPCGFGALRPNLLGDGVSSVPVQTTLKP